MIKKSTDLEKSFTKSDECTEIILAAKEKYINEFSKNLAILKQHLKRTGKY